MHSWYFVMEKDNNVILYAWHRHKDIYRYPWYMPQDIAADMAVVISCGIATGYNGDMRGISTNTVPNHG